MELGQATSQRLAGIVGWPLGHTLSPAMHEAAYEQMGLDWLYLALPVPDEVELARVFEALRVLPFVGLNVTMPHKAAALRLCDDADGIARRAGATNTIRVEEGRLIAHSTDGAGLLESLAEEAGFSPEGSRVAIIGAGGAAAAAAFALAEGGAADVAVANRTLGRAEELVTRLSDAQLSPSTAAFSLADIREAVREADLVINATPLGMGPYDASPVPASWLNEGQVVADMVYRPTETALMRSAREAGAVVVGGLGMLVSQGALAIEIWGAGSAGPAPRGVMRRAAKRALAHETNEERDDGDDGGERQAGLQDVGPCGADHPGPAGGGPARGG